MCKAAVTVSGIALFYALSSRTAHQNNSSAFRTSSSSLNHQIKTSLIITGNKSLLLPPTKTSMASSSIEPLRQNKQDPGLNPEEPQMWSSCSGPRALPAFYYCARGNSLCCGMNDRRKEERVKEFQRRKIGGGSCVGMK